MRTRTTFSETVAQRDAKTFDIRGQFSRNLRGTASRDLATDIAAATSVSVRRRPLSNMASTSGIDYARPLSATRRAIVRVLPWARRRLACPSHSWQTLASREVYRDDGQCTLGYQFARSWQVKATYRTGARLHP